MSQVLRDDLLAGVSVLVAGPGLGSPSSSAPQTPPLPLASRLGARLLPLAPELDEAGEGGAAWVAAQDPVDALVFDGREPARGGLEGGRDVLDAAWVACAAAANGAFIPGGRGGRIVLIAPSPGDGDLAAAAVAGLENLARTLSVEWARYAITTVTIAPSPSTQAGDLAELVAFLLSPAGAYFSGARLSLDVLGP